MSQPPSGGGSGGGGGDTSTDAAWAFGAILFLVVLGWYLGHDYIVAAVRAVRLNETGFIGWFTDSIAPIDRWWRVMPTANITFERLAAASSAVGRYLRWPAAAILATGGMFMILREYYRKTFNMHGLLQSEQAVWPQVAPVARLNLIGDNPPQWDKARSPREFVRDHRLVTADGVFQRDQAVAVFASQLGTPFTDAADLPDPARALFTVLVARLTGDKTSARRFLDQFSRSSARDKLDISGIDEYLKIKASASEVVAIVRQHHYVATVLASMLERARGDGVLASAEFLWLKPVDRRLWYMLNNVGRRVAWVEVAGLWSHWIIEKAAAAARLTSQSGGIATPQVRPAVDALELALKETLHLTQ